MKCFVKRRDAGFTLVELIVVIVILGVLAAVSVPAYTGYVAKAKEAQDLQLLGAVNTAYAAACAELGVEPTAITAAAPLKNGYVQGVAAHFGNAANLSASSNDLNSSFLRYYGDNIEKPFQVYKGLWYNRDTGTFENAEGTATVTYKGTTVTYDKADFATYQASTFQEIGTTELTEKMDSLTKLTLGSSWFTNDDTNPGFTDFFDSLGVDTSGMSDADIKQAKANALVLYAARGAEGVDTDKWYEQLLNGESPTIDTNDLANQTITSSSAMYALMTAYANSSDDTTVSIKVKDGGTKQETWDGTYDTTKYSSIEEYVKDTYGEDATYSYNQLNEMLTGNGHTVFYTAAVEYETKSASDYFNTEAAKMNNTDDVAALYETFVGTKGFQDYLKTQGKSDWDGFFSAMNIINDNVGTEGGISAASVVTNGYQGEDLNDLLKYVLGN